MNLNFDFQTAKNIEFGIGRDNDNEQAFYFVPADTAVQVALCEMAQATWNSAQVLTETPSKYEPSEKYPSCEHIYLPIHDAFAQRMRDLHQANNLSVDSNSITDPSNIFCYFVRMSDNQGRRLTGLRRATQFKGVLKNRLIRLVSDALKIIEDKVFKLDVDFDLLIDDDKLHILRPSGFEFAGQLQVAILEAMPKNIQTIQEELQYVDFSSIQEFASSRPRAARYIASIRSQTEIGKIDKNSLKKLCKSTGVSIKESKGKIIVEKDVVMDFLEVLDRRRYKVELIKGAPEQFKAGSRTRLQIQNGAKE